MNSNLALSWLPIAAFGILVLFILGIILLNRNNKKEGPYVLFADITDVSDIPPKKDKKEYYFFPLQKSGLSDASSFLQEYLLKWIIDDVVRKEDGRYILEGSPVFESNHERNWFVLLNKLPGGILLMEPEFRKKEEKNIRENMQDLRGESIGYLLKNEYMKTSSSRIMNENVEHYSYTEKGLELQKELISYRNYLKQRKSIGEKELPWLAIYGLEYKNIEDASSDITKEDYDWAKRFSDFYKKVS